MMNEGLFERTHILLGDEGIRKLRAAKVIIFGAGGVGSFVMEGLARMGVGRLVLVDFDVVSASNMNRQLPALRSTIGTSKVQVMRDRILDINPDCEVVLHEAFVHPDDIPPMLERHQPDYVVDCIDTLNVKVNLLLMASQMGFPVASSMGAGNKLDPTKIRVAPIMKTEACHLARFVRHRIRRQGGISKKVKAVYSTEVARKPAPPEPTEGGRPRAVNGTVSYMPALFGLTLTGVIVNDLVEAG
jgi:tRNA A37 threonylcarbamoyladenosine dehydratase